MKVPKGIYLTLQVRYELKKIACTYHVTLKSVIPAILLQIVNDSKSYIYSDLKQLPGPRKLKNIVIEECLYDRLKCVACDKKMKLNDFINAALLNFISNNDMTQFMVNNGLLLKHTVRHWGKYLEE